MRSLLRITTLLLVVLSTVGAFAVEPAGGPASEQIGSLDEFTTRSSAAVVPVAEEASPPVQRDWLAKSRRSTAAPAEKSSGSLLLNLLAGVLLVGLGGGAVYLKKRRPASRTAQVAQAIKILSQVRVGPKAQLVTTEVAGRVMLLGVTESQVRCLSWLDAPSQASEAADDTDLGGGEEKVNDPEDFTAGYAAHAPPGPNYSPVARAATERFREVMNGILQSQKGNRTDAKASAPVSSAAQLLARETKDVVQASSVGKLAQTSDSRESPETSNVVSVSSKATPRRARRKSLEGLEAQVAGLVARQER